MFDFEGKVWNNDFSIRIWVSGKCKKASPNYASLHLDKYIPLQGLWSGQTQ